MVTDLRDLLFLNAFADIPVTLQVIPFTLIVSGILTESFCNIVHIPIPCILSVCSCLVNHVKNFSSFRLSVFDGNIYRNNLSSFGFLWEDNESSKEKQEYQNSYFCFLHVLPQRVAECQWHSFCNDRSETETCDPLIT